MALNVKDINNPPYPSWVWDAEKEEWLPSIPKPKTNYEYVWDEQDKEWVELRK